MTAFEWIEMVRRNNGLTIKAFVKKINYAKPIDRCEWVSLDGKCHLPACLKDKA